MKLFQHVVTCMMLVISLLLVSSCQRNSDVNEEIRVILNEKDLGGKSIMEYLRSEYGDRKLSRIKLLQLVRNGLKRIDDLSQLTNLQDLTIAANGIERIEGLSGLRNLRILSLVQNRIAKIEGLEGLQNLEVLLLNHNNVKRIEGLRGLHNLRELDLSDNNIEVIEGLEGLGSLQDFRVGGNKIRDFKGLLALKGLKESITLLSQRNIVTPEARAILEQVQKNNPNAEILLDKTDWGTGEGE